MLFYTDTAFQRTLNFIVGPLYRRITAKL